MNAHLFPQPVARNRSESYWAIVRRQFWKRRLNRAACAVIALLFAVGLLADFVASDLPILLSLEGETYVFPNLLRPPELRRWDNTLLLEEMGENDWAVMPPVPWGYNSHDLSSVLSPPGPGHVLGTDSEGRDVLSRVVHGTRVSLAVGVLSVVVVVLIGVVLGSVAAYFGGAFDLLLMRLVEVVHALPTILLLVTILSVVMLSGWASVVGMMLVIGLVGWTGVARLTRGEILKVKTMEYVEAARALGYSHLRIVARHILPNSISPVLVSATFAMAAAILIESALSFLGFGISPDMASWGGLLSDGRKHADAWWLAVFPGAAIFVTVTVYNMAGEGLRDAIDPRLKV
ncbi:MAG: ABC transporter permease [Myxococcales bacterium]|nr:ABC transporter permease [Myxococcales bacterium]